MLKLKHLVYGTYKKYNNETNLYVSKFDYKLLKITDEIIKIPRTIDKVISYLLKAMFFIVSSIF